MKKYSKQTFCISNSDGTPSTPNNFQVNFSNSNVTNVQSNQEQTKTYFTPQLFTCDWFFNNVSEAVGNNKFVVTQPGAQVQVVAINPAPFAAQFQQSANSAAYAFNGVVAPTVTVTLNAPALAGAGQAYVTCHNQTTNAVIATSSTEFVPVALAPVTFTFGPSRVFFPAAAGIYFRVYVIGAFASYNYGVDATPILAMTYTAGPGVAIIIPDNVYDGPSFLTAVNAAMVGQFSNVGGVNVPFNNLFDVVTSKWTWRLATNATPPVSAAQNVLTTISFVNTIGGVTYNAAKLFGNVSEQNSIDIPINPLFSIVMPGNVDLVPYQVIRLHSNCAKRTFQKSAPQANGTSILQGTDILVEIPVYNANIGSTITWSPTDASLYRQDLVSNFDQFNISIRDKYGNLIPLLSNCEVNLSFIIEREVILPTPDDVRNSIANYAEFSML